LPPKHGQRHEQYFQREEPTYPPVHALPHFLLHGCLVEFVFHAQPGPKRYLVGVRLGAAPDYIV
jgi:hypothetical protein